jgi:peroxiredoxin
MDSMYFQQLTVEKKAPDFLLSALEGDQSRLSQYQGNVVLISFWATL